MTPDALPSLSAQVNLVRARLREFGRAELSEIAAQAQVSVPTLYRIRTDKNVSVKVLDRVQVALAARS